MKLSDVNIGQSVRVNNEHSVFHGLLGTVRGKERGEWVAIEFETTKSWFHDCDGLAREGYGYYLHNDNIEIVTSIQNKNLLPTDAAERKKIPFVTGLLDYFPAALVEVAKVSYQGNLQHNPGQELHWSRGKSNDYADTIGRHLLERGGTDVDGMRHSAKLAWRALALLQIELEAEGAPLARGAKLKEEKS